MSEIFNPNELTGEVPDIDEVKFDLPGMESYFERNVLKVGEGVLSTLGIEIAE